MMRRRLEMDIEVADNEDGTTGAVGEGGGGGPEEYGEQKTNNP